MFPRGLGFVVTAARRTFVVVDRWPELRTQEATVVAREAFGGAVLAAPVGRWPDDLAAWSEVTLRSVEGASCAVPGGALHEVRWVDVDLDDPLTAVELWATPPREAVLAVEVAVPDGCDPVWAHPRSVIPSQVFGVAPDPEATARDLERFHASADVAAIAAEYARFREEEIAAGFGAALPLRWVDYDGVERATRLQGDRGQTFVLVEAAAGTDCGGFGAAVWHLYEEIGGHLVRRASGEGEPAPLGLIELEGQLVLLGHDWARAPADEQPLVDLDTEPFVCGC